MSGSSDESFKNFTWSQQDSVRLKVTFSLRVPWQMKISLRYQTRQIVKLNFMSRNSFVVSHAYKKCLTFQCLETFVREVFLASNSYDYVTPENSIVSTYIYNINVKSSLLVDDLVNYNVTILVAESMITDHRAITMLNQREEAIWKEEFEARCQPKRGRDSIVARVYAISP